MKQPKVYRPRLGIGICPICGGIKDRAGQRYCRLCHNAYVRRQRRRYADYSFSDKILNIMRSTTNTLIKRGQLKVSDQCAICGSPDQIENHHLLPPNPYLIQRLCRFCHKQEHIRQ